MMKNYVWDKKKNSVLMKQSSGSKIVNQNTITWSIKIRIVKKKSVFLKKRRDRKEDKKYLLKCFYKMTWKEVYLVVSQKISFQGVSP